MVTQIFAKPDENGIVRICCGSDMLEIHIIHESPAEPPEPGGSGGTFPGGRISNPFNRYRPYLDNPFRKPGSYMIDLPPKTNGGLDHDGIIEEIRRFTSDPGASVVLDTIVLSHPHVDLHDVCKLEERISENKPKISLGVDFSAAK